MGKGERKAWSKGADWARRLAAAWGAPLDREPRERSPMLRALVGRRGVFADNLALGVSVAAGLEVAQRLYARPGHRASLDGLVARLTGQGQEEGAPRPEVEAQAEWIAALFRAAGVAPQRLGVDGLPGSGKSTLARALARRLGVRWQCLDYAGLDRELDLSDLGVVLEHHRLFRTQDVDRFDALVYLDAPVEHCRQRVLERRRGGFLVELVDFERLKRVGDQAFALTDGRAYAVPRGFARVKLRPAGGYRLRANAEAALAAAGVRAGGLTQEQLVFLTCDRQARQGFLAYVNAEGTARDLLASVCDALDAAGQRR